jgi:MFS family permease
MEIRFLRSIAQGALTVDFVLYLRYLHWSAAAIGGLVAASGLVGTVLMLASGIASDRWGRKPFLLGYQAATLVGALAVVLRSRSWALPAAAIALGYGRGTNGSAGPFGPVEQAWLSQVVGRSRRGQVFSLNGALGFWGMGVGSLLGSAVPLFRHWSPGSGGYVPLFVLSLIVAAANLWQVATVREDTGPRRAPSQTHGGPGTTAAATPEAGGHSRRRHENVAMLLLASVNIVNSLGIGLFSPLLPYWFAARFGVGAAAIGSVYGLAFLLTGFSSLATGQLTTRVGLVRAVVWVRLAGVALLLAIPWMPTYPLAALAYVARSIFNRGSAGARQAFGVGLVREHRRGLASSLNALSMRLPSAVAPAVGGWLLSSGALDLPFYLAAALQFAYVLLFATVLSRYETPPSAQPPGPGVA